MDMNERPRVSAVKSNPVLAFVGSGTLPEYVGLVHAAITDTRATVVRVSDDTMPPSDAMLVITPGSRREPTHAKRLEEERKAIELCSSCCLLLQHVRQIPESGYLYPAMRKKVKLIVFHGDPVEHPSLQRVVQLLFKHLHAEQVIFDPQQSDAIDIAERIVALAA